MTENTNEDNRNVVYHIMRNRLHEEGLIPTPAQKEQSWDHHLTITEKTAIERMYESAQEEINFLFKHDEMLQAMDKYEASRYQL